MFSCTCVDYDPAKVESVVMRKARKEHICDECGVTIGKGQVHEVRNYLDYKWHVHKTCSVCVRVRNDFMSCGFVFGMVWEDIHEANCDNDFCMCPERSSP